MRSARRWEAAVSFPDAPLKEHRSLNQSRNLAARAGRWSAQHRKTAILGWIAFVVLATVLGGKVGQNNIDESAQGNGESKRGDMIIDAAGFPEQAGERVLVQGKGVERSAGRRGRHGRRAPARGDPGHHRDREPARPAQPREHGLRGRPLGRRELHDPGLRRACRAARRQAAGRRRRGPEGAPRRARRAVRRRLGDQGDRRPGRQGRQEVRVHLLRPDADHPARRVRRVRRRRPSARARRHRRRGHDRPARAASASSTGSRPTSPSSW